MIRLRHPLVVLFTLVLLASCADGVTDPEGPGPDPAARASVEALSAGPDVIPLPLGFQPEGLTRGRGSTFFVGSLAGGAIYRGNLLTGAGDILVPSSSGGVAVGLDVDEGSNLLWVAGGPTGDGSVYDAATGALVAEFPLAPGFVNDVVVTREAAWFTNSFSPVLHRVAIDAAGRPTGGAESIPLTGDFQFVTGTFNANGIAATRDGATLIVVNSTTGSLYTVDPGSGEATEIQGVSTPGGDGLVLGPGPTLYVVQNFLNQVAVIRLSPDLSAGQLIDVLTSPLFRIPATADGFGPFLYAVNARFDVVPTTDTEYEIVRVPR